MRCTVGTHERAIWCISITYISTRNERRGLSGTPRRTIYAGPLRRAAPCRAVSSDHGATPPFLTAPSWFPVQFLERRHHRRHFAVPRGAVLIHSFLIYYDSYGLKLDASIQALLIPGHAAQLWMSHRTSMWEPRDVRYWHSIYLHNVWTHECVGAPIIFIVILFNRPTCSSNTITYRNP